MNLSSAQPVVSEFVAPALAGALVEGFKMEVYSTAVDSFVAQTLLVARGIATADSDADSMEWALTYREIIERIASRHSLSVSDLVEMGVKSITNKLDN